MATNSEMQFAISWHQKG